MTDSWRSSDRGLSSVLGVAVLFGIVLVVSVAMVVASTTALQNSRQSTGMERAELAMSDLDSAIASLDPASPHARVTSLEGLSGNDGNLTVTDAGSIHVEVTEATSGTTLLSEGRSLGAIEYRRGNEVIAYQSGGIYRTSASGDDVVVVSPPNFDYRYRDGQPTLSVPVVSVAGGGAGQPGTGDLELRQTDGPETVFPTGAGATNPLDDSVTVNVTVQSEYYRAWGEVFQQNTDAYVVWDHANDTVRMVLVGQGSEAGRSSPDVAASIVTGSSLTITNGGRLDSYDSANGGYPGWRAKENADVVVDGDFTLNSKPDVSGDVFVSGQLTVDNDPIVYGRTITGGTPGDSTVDDVPNAAEFRQLFSTTDDLNVDEGASAYFGGPVIVGGTVEEFGADEVRGPIHVTGDADLEHGTVQTDLYGDVIADGQVDVDQDVVFHGSDRTIVADGDVTFDDGTYDVDVVTSGDVDLQNGATIDGDVDAGGNVYVDGDVTGTVVADGTITPTTEMEPGWQQLGSPTPPPMDRLRSPEPVAVAVPDRANDEIADNETALSAANDNTGSPIAEIENYEGCDPGCTLEAGEYYLDDRLRITSKESLTIDTTDGDVSMYVRDNVLIKGEITVTGQNAVRIYTPSNLIVEGSDASVRTPDDDASQLWVYLRDDAEATFRSGAPVFTGMVYGPGSSSTTGAEIGMNNDATVYGSLIGQISTFNSGSALHYDENLDYVSSSDSAYVDDSGRIVYLQFTSRTVEVER